MHQHVIIPHFISASEVEQLIAHAEQANCDYRTHRGGNVYCTVAWIHEDHPGYQRLTAKIWQAVHEQNEQRFQLGPLAPSFEQYQYTDYNQPGDAYGWHADSAPRPDYLARRRLTVTITLTDASEHEGGGFQLSDHVGHSTAPDASALYESMPSLNDDERVVLGQKGTLIIFPSNRMHRALPVLSGTRKVLICWVSCPPQPEPSISERLQAKFTDIYHTHFRIPGERERVAASEFEQTRKLRDELAILIQRLGIKSMLDIPCRDFSWMREVVKDGIDYTGADIVADVVEHNRAAFPGTKFELLDITRSSLPKVDLVFVRDCLGHLSDANVLKALDNIRRSGSRYLLATSFTKYHDNPDIEDGGWRCINLMIQPFHLKPQYLINEDCQQGYPHFNDKCMILFDLENLVSQ